MISENNIESLLPDYFSGRLTEEEGKLVDAWICESAEHRKIAEDYCRLEHVLSSVEAPDNVNTEFALKAVHSRMRRNSVSSFTLHFQRIAAIATIPLLVSVIWLGTKYYGSGSDRQISISSVPGLTANTVLPDGSTVWLNSNSTLSYPVRFGKVREVTLEGQAYFKVEKQQGRSFIVHAKGSAVEVLGTEFDVEAYPTDDLVRTTLLHGSVRFAVPSDGPSPFTYLLKPGERYTWDRAAGKVLRSTVNPSTAAAWKDGRIVLDNTSLEEALRQIGNRFNVEFLIRNQNLLSHSYTGTFTAQRLEVVLEHFKRTTNIHFDYQLQGTETEKVSGRQKILVY
ncbi:MAG: FecR domain-containing protein [Bacteroidales bacterium]|nr:FecR domain-containing protein [Bacteroidales bacterium]